MSPACRGTRAQEVAFGTGVRGFVQRVARLVLSAIAALADKCGHRWRVLLEEHHVAFAPGRTVELLDVARDIAPPKNRPLGHTPSARKHETETRFEWRWLVFSNGGSGDAHEPLS